MDRAEMLFHLDEPHKVWDFVIVGGGATGLGTAIDGASRGFQTLCLEQSDFAKGTSSRSTKLIHGGLRYLQQGNISLVLEALKERCILRRNAPHLVHNLPFIVPRYDWWEGPFYGIGLKLYDALAGRHGFGSSQLLSLRETLERIPTIETHGLRGGVMYYDGQFDDARLAIDMAQTAVDQGATVINYMPVTDLLKKDGAVCGVAAQDAETGREFEIPAKCVINATGVFSDVLLQRDDPQASRLITPSQGTHIVLDASFLPGETAIMVPHTADGRVLFATPWHDRVIVGTTDILVDSTSLEPIPQAEEIEFLLSHAARYLTKDPSADDVLSIFAGLRPLVGSGKQASTATISRDHTVHISHSGLLTITGGKWTTYRKMAEDAIDQAATLAMLDDRPCVTRDLNLHGAHHHAERFGPLRHYGSDAPQLSDLLREEPEFDQPLHPSFATRAGEVVWAVRHEMARTVEDFLARRTRALLLDARASMEAAPRVAHLMAQCLGRNAQWVDDQIDAYRRIATRYLIPSRAL